MKHLIYELLYVIGCLIYLPKALWRRRLPHRGWRMRLGIYRHGIRRRLEGRSALWIHAVSVGEVMAARPLARALLARYAEHPLVISAVTHSGFSVAEREFGPDGVMVYFPLDLSVCVRRALATVNPRILLLMESELWPNMIRLAKARGVPVVVVNGRISPRSVGRHAKVKGWLSDMWQGVDLFLMQTQEDADRVIQLGARPATVQVVGSLKWESSLAKRPTKEQLTTTATRIGISPTDIVIVAGSTHKGEEEALLNAYQVLRRAHRGARLIIAPRHLERLDDVEDLIEGFGYTSVRFSRAPVVHRWEVGLVDTFGQLQQYYGLASVVFVGGSLIPHGGQNPLEAASLGRPIVFGPYMYNFSNIAHELLEHDAARQVAEPDKLGPLLQDLMSEHVATEEMGGRARVLTERSHNTTDRILEACAPLLSREESR